jgi:hypothetical protein
MTGFVPATERRSDRSSRPDRQARARRPRPGRRHSRNGHVLICLLIPLMFPENYSQHGRPRPRKFSVSRTIDRKITTRCWLFLAVSLPPLLRILIWQGRFLKLQDGITIRQLRHFFGRHKNTQQQTRSGPIRCCTRKPINTPSPRVRQGCPGKRNWLVRSSRRTRPILLGRACPGHPRLFAARASVQRRRGWPGQARPRGVTVVQTAPMHCKACNTIFGQPCAVRERGSS